MKIKFAALSLTLAVACTATLCRGQTFTVIHNFDSGSGGNAYGNPINSDGVNPIGGLFLTGNTLYGETDYGGSSGCGTVFRINTDGTGFAVLKALPTYTFNFEDAINSGGAYPRGGPAIFGAMLYGTAITGGSYGGGTLFKMNTNGTGFTVVHNFGSCNSGCDASDPWSDLTLSGDTLYGVTRNLHGTVSPSNGPGTIYEINTNNTNGSYAILKSFTSINEGVTPGALVVSNGVCYGMAQYGGADINGRGTVFAMNTDGTGYTVLHDFVGTNEGEATPGPLVLSGTTLYGVGSSQGNSSFRSTVWALNTDDASFTVLHTFTGTPDGDEADGPLVLSGNTLYGTTRAGGSSNSGTIFQIKTDGTGYSVLKSFSSSSDGVGPGGLTISGSTVYGTASTGGSGGSGTVFSFSLSPRLFVQQLRDKLILSWTNAAFNLQSAPEPAGIYTNIPNATSPYTNTITSNRQFFRLILD